MNQHRDISSLRQMLEHAVEARGLIEKLSRDELDSERVLSLALVRLMEIVGEAANRISPESRAKYPSIPWGEIVSLRNRLVHGYASVDHSIVWDVVAGDLAEVIDSLRELLSEG